MISMPAILFRVRGALRGHIPTYDVGPLFRPPRAYASGWAKVKEKEHLLEK